MVETKILVVTIILAFTDVMAEISVPVARIDLHGIDTAMSMTEDMIPII